jgi:hypothetical protein
MIDRINKIAKTIAENFTDGKFSDSYKLHINGCNIYIYSFIGHPGVVSVHIREGQYCPKICPEGYTPDIIYNQDEDKDNFEGWTRYFYSSKKKIKDLYKQAADRMGLDPDLLMEEVLVNHLSGSYQGLIDIPEEMKKPSRKICWDCETELYPEWEGKEWVFPTKCYKCKGEFDND